jgi:hypothetical protein
MTTESIFNLYFTILSDHDEFDCDLIKTEFTEMPNILQKKGEIKPNHRVIKYNTIQFSHKAIGSANVSKVFLELIDFLKLNEASIQKYGFSDSSSVSLDLTGDFVVGTPRPLISYSKEVIKLLASLNCALNIEIYAISRH